MKRYIKPSTDILNVELQIMMAGSTPLSNSDATVDGNGDYNDAKGLSIFSEDYDSSADPTPQTFNVWED